MKQTGLALLLAAAVVSTPLLAADDFSVAEKRLFLEDHLKNIRHAETLSYSFEQQSAKPEDSFADKAEVQVKEAAGGKKAVNVEFLSGPHRLSLPDFEDATANPIILYFLEMDVRDMHRLVGGQEAYFRKRIRLAFVDKATVKPVTVQYQGHAVEASEISITPFVEDPLKERFGKYVGKSYTFTMSDKVPGGVYQIRTEVDDPAAAAATPLMKTVLSLKTANG